MSGFDSKIEALALGDFLCGAQGADPWCKQHFSDYIDDIDTQWDADEMEHLRGDYWLAPSKDSMLLLERQGSAFDVVGFYCTPGAVCIEDKHQGKGLGAELILATYQWLGGPPTAGLDQQCFSRSGYAAHIAAWRLGVERGIFITPSASPQQRRRPIAEAIEPGL